MPPKCRICGEYWKDRKPVCKCKETDLITNLKDERLICDLQHPYTQLLIASLRAMLEKNNEAKKELREMRSVLSELVDLMEAVREGEYTPDSFTTQPARVLLASRSISTCLQTAEVQIREAVHDYYLGLDSRHHGGIAAKRLADKIQEILGMRWLLGNELRRRAGKEG